MVSSVRINATDVETVVVARRHGWPRRRHARSVVDCCRKASRIWRFSDQSADAVLAKGSPSGLLRRDSGYFMIPRVKNDANASPISRPE